MRVKLRRRISQWIIPILVSIAIPTIAPSTALAAGAFQVDLISPAQGSRINPDLPFTITLNLTGGLAANANHCDDSVLDSFTFGVELIGDQNLAKALGWGDSNQGYETTAGTLNSAWTTKLLPNGVQCSLAIGEGKATFHEGLSEKDYEWFGTKQTTWSGNVSNFKNPVSMDIAWAFPNESVQHHLYSATQDGNPKISIVGLNRADVINYEKSFQVVATMSKSLAFDRLYAYQNVTPQDDRVLPCDTRSTTKTVTADLATYTTTCYLRLWSYFDSGDIATLDVHTYLAADKNYEGPSVSVSIGKPGIPRIEVIRPSDSQVGSPDFVSTDSKKPWQPPALFSIKGKACATSDLSCSGSLDILPGLPIKLCLNSSCVDLVTDTKGLFSFSQTLKTSVANWNIEASYNGIPLTEETLNPETSFGRALAASGSSSLPSAPLKVATTTLRVSIANPASVKWGSPIPLKVTMKGKGSATCQLMTAYANSRGTYTPTNTSGIGTATFTGGTTKTVNAFLPLDYKARWYLRMICWDNKNGAYLPWGESFISNT
jgi:hypothetical protein